MPEERNSQKIIGRQIESIEVNELYTPQEAHK
jgi:hypothetical protein